MTEKTLDEVKLSQLAIECVIGIYDYERTRTQPLKLDISFFIEPGNVESPRLQDSVDYAHFSGEVQFLLQSARFLLVEDVAEAVARYALTTPTPDAPRAQVKEVTVTVHKPRALFGRAIPSFRIHRKLNDFHPRLQETAFGTVEALFEKSMQMHSVGIYRVRVKPRGVISTHCHPQSEEHEFILGQGLRLQEKAVRRGTAVHWPKGVAHGYENQTDIEQTLLRVTTPAFQAAHEMEVPKPEGVWTSPQTEYLYIDGESDEA